MTPSSPFIVPDAQRIEQWQDLYIHRLPYAATRKISTQTRWPVTLDHCFGRIIYDVVLGGASRTSPDGEISGKSWREVIKAPAIKHMTVDQVEGCIKLGEEILEGKVDLVELNEMSLEVRGKLHGNGKGTRGTKRKVESLEASGSPKNELKKSVGIKAEQVIDLTVDTDIITQSTTKAVGETTPSRTVKILTLSDFYSRGPSLNNPQSHPILKLITTHPELTAFRKSVLTLICQIPRGRFTTYAALSSHLSSCPRAIGSALRNNPFAGLPSASDEESGSMTVAPCHRILARDGSIGGFGGQWGEGSENAKVKKAWLREEGVRFDVKGKAVGRVFDGFK